MKVPKAESIDATQSVRNEPYRRGATAEVIG
jgi:hypothetical protein